MKDAMTTGAYKLKVIVTLRMTLGIIVRLEVVDIDHQGRDRVCRRKKAVNVIGEAPSVVQSGQCIRLKQVPECKPMDVGSASPASHDPWARVQQYFQIIFAASMATATLQVLL